MRPVSTPSREGGVHCRRGPRQVGRAMPSAAMHFHLTRRPATRASAHREPGAGQGAVPDLPCPPAMLCAPRSLRVCVGWWSSSPSFARGSWRCGATAGGGARWRDGAILGAARGRGTTTTRVGHPRRGALRSDLWTLYVFRATLLITMGRVHAQGLWSVSSGGSVCELSADGMCVSDGDGDYGNNERCTVRAEAAIVVSAQAFGRVLRLCHHRRYGLSRQVRVAHDLRRLEAQSAFAVVARREANSLRRPCCPGSSSSASSARSSSRAHSFSSKWGSPNGVGSPTWPRCVIYWRARARAAWPEC
jgi:hypothetical protein